MTLAELQNYFGAEDGYFYRAIRYKTGIELLNDLNTTVSTFEHHGLYVRTLKEVTHEDYVRITE